MKRGAALKRKSKSPLTKEQKLRRRLWFEAVTKGKKCAVCGAKGSLVRPIQGHHIVSQRYLKDHLYQLDEDEETVLWGELAWANGLAIDSQCHELHTLRARPITRNKLPPASVLWANQRGLLDYIKTNYPEGD